MMIHDYQAGRSVCSFVEFCAWAGVVIAVILVLIAFGASTRGGGSTLALAAIVPALTLLVFCFILVVLTQMARATMDGSVAAQKNVIQAQKHHEELVRSLRSYASREVVDEVDTSIRKLSIADALPPTREQQTGKEPAPRRKLLPKTSGVTEYRGRQIRHDGGSHWVGKACFSHIENAQLHIDQHAKANGEPDSHQPIADTPSRLE